MTLRALGQNHGQMNTEELANLRISVILLVGVEVTKGRLLVKTEG